MPFRDEENAELDPREFPDPEDGTTKLGMLPCPHCMAVVYEECSKCPRCGEYLTASDLLTVRKPWWMIITALICLSLTLWSIFWGI